MRKTGAKGRLIVISAPSGCGKTTLCKRLLADKLDLIHSISMTTRPLRLGERDGTDYHFISKKDFKQMVRKKEFLEYEENFGHLYGTPKKFVEDSLKDGKSLLLSIDVKGAMKVKTAYPKDSTLVFILAPSLEVLKRRLKSRRADSKATISTRLKVAQRELSYIDKYDYKIINDKLDSAYRRLKRVITKEIG